MAQKQYGLILPKKQGTSKPAPIFTSKNVFGEESDSGEETPIQKVSVNAGEKLQRQAKALQSKVLEEDPTVYQYDELYDDIEEKKKKAKAVTKVDKKPKYIEKLLQTAEKRKRENERRVERQVQKEREEEGDQFADKESYVTSAYKQKLEEMKADEEKERREAYLESIGDVTKQSDLSGFYRHLYEQQLQPEKVRNFDEEKPKTEAVEETTKEKDVDSDNNSKDSANDEDKEKKPKKQKDKRTYRKRKQSDTQTQEKEESGDSEEEINRRNIEILKTGPTQANLDADSDFSIDSSSSEDESEEKKPKKAKKEEQPEIKIEIKEEIPEETPKEPEFKVPEPVKDNTKSAREQAKDIIAKRPKVDIWKKRTVGEVFDQALQRYYERKAQRGC